MAQLEQVFGTSTSVTLGDTSPADGAVGESSSPIDFAVTNPPLDCQLGISFTSGGTAQDQVEVYARGSEDGTNFEGEAGGNGNKDNMKLIGFIPVSATSTVYRWTGMLAEFFGGKLPREVHIAIYNESGAEITGLTLTRTFIHLQTP